MKEDKKPKKVFVCHECNVVGAAVDEDCCCTGCGCDLDACEENVYSLGPHLVEYDSKTAREARRLRVLLRKECAEHSRTCSCEACYEVYASEKARKATTISGVIGL